MNEVPVITFLCSTYNRPQELKRIIQNFREQDYPHWELLILDESPEKYSHDLVMQAIKDGEKRVKAINFNHANDWGYSAKQEAAHLYVKKKCEWIGFCNDDHQYQNTYIGEMLRIGTMNKSHMVICGFSHRTQGTVHPSFTIGNVDIGTFIIKKDTFCKYGFDSENLRVADGKLVECVSKDWPCMMLCETLVNCP